MMTLIASIPVIYGILNLVSCVEGFKMHKFRSKQLITSSTSQSVLAMQIQSSPGDADILVRAYKGEEVERVPVWLMRQV